MGLLYKFQQACVLVASCEEETVCRVYSSKMTQILMLSKVNGG